MGGIECGDDAGGQRRIVDRGGQARRLRRRVRGRADDPADDVDGRGEIGRLGERDLQGALSDTVFELVGIAGGDDGTAVDDDQRVGQLIGLVEILGGQQHRGALRDQVAHGRPHLGAGGRIETGGGFVEEQQRRPGDHRRGEVDAPPHAAGEPGHRPIRGVREAELFDQFGGARTGGRSAMPEQAGEEFEVLDGGEVLVERGVLAGERDQ